MAAAASTAASKAAPKGDASKVAAKAAPAAKAAVGAKSAHAAKTADRQTAPKGAVARQTNAHASEAVNCSSDVAPVEAGTQPSIPEDLLIETDEQCTRYKEVFKSRYAGYCALDEELGANTAAFEKMERCGSGGGATRRGSGLVLSSVRAGLRGVESCTNLTP